MARRLASLATDTEAATPTEQVMPCSSWIGRAQLLGDLAAGEPSRRVEPRTSRNASSSETTSTSGVTRRKVSITEAETVVNVVVVGRDHHRLRAQPAGPGRRHRRADAVLAGEVVGRQHHPALAAADDHRHVPQVGPVADRHRRVEGVHVDVQDRAVRTTGQPSRPPAPGSGGSAGGDDVQLGGEGEVLGALGDGLLELDQGGGGAGLEVEQGAGDQVGEDPDAVHRRRP